MINEIIQTEFAIFRLNEEKGYFAKEYRPMFLFLAENDFQNSRSFEGNSPFFVPKEKPSIYPLKQLKTLSDWQKDKLSDLNYTQKAFQIAEKLIAALANLHQRGIVYGCLTPNTILVDETENVWFSEWSFHANNKISSSFFFDTPLLHYIAPEQTNRNQSILNFKTDLYALGVVLLELFTKENPFRSNNELDTIHRHRIFIPNLSIKQNTEMGVAVGQVILKLIEKNPDKRFNNIESCAKSFALAKQYFDENRFDEKIDLEQGKTPEFIFNQNLQIIYKNEIDELKHIFENTYQNKLGSICLVEGKNGVQKSEIINCFFQEIESENVLSVSLSLKNDQQTPLASFRELLKSITQYYLTRPEDEVLNFKNIVESRIGIAIDVLYEVYPKIAQIIPQVDKTASNKGLELRSQLIFAVAEFLKSFVQTQKKLLVHFRGFQFSTNTTLAVIEGLMKELPLNNLIFLISYEEDLLAEPHQKIIEKLKQDEFKLLDIRELRIQPCTITQIKETLVDAKTNPNEIDFVADILWAKSNGMTNFLKRIIEDLLQKNKIKYNENKAHWEFEKESLIAAINFSKNLEEYHKKLFSTYTPYQMKVLKVAAQIGDVFQKNILKKVSEVDDFEETLTSLTENNILKSINNTNDFVFIDNEIRNYCLNIPSISHSFDKKIVDAYLEAYPEIDKSEYFYSFLNKILALTDAKPYKNWIEKGLEFAHKIADFDVTFLCSKKLVEILDASDWETNYKKTFETHVNYLDACSFSMKSDEVKATHSYLIEKIQNETQFVYLERQFAEALLLSHEFEESVRVCRNALNKVNISIAESPSLLRIIYSSVRMRMLMKDKDLAFFQQLPVITEEKELYKIRLLQTMIGISFITNPKMIPELIYKQANFVIKNGFSLTLGIGIACHAFMNANYQKKYAEANTGYELAESIAQLLNDNRTDDVNHFLYAAFIQPWFYNFKITFQQLLNNFQHCRQTGYVNMAFYNAIFLGYHAVLSEENIDEVKSKITEILPYLNANTPLNGIDTVIVSLRFLQLIGRKEEDYLTMYFNVPFLNDINERVRFGVDKNNAVKRNYLFSIQFYLKFINEEYEIDRNDVIFCKQSFLTQGEGYYLLHFSYYYASLNYVKLRRRLDGFEEKYVKHTIKQLYNNIKIHQENYEAKAFFLDGLYDLKENKTAEGLLKLQKAFEASIKFEQFLTAAFVAKEIGRLYEKLTYKKQSLDYFSLAIKYFKKYGADILADKLLNQYPELEIKETQTLNLGQKIDLQSFINASTTISAEIKLDSLLEKMMNVLAENAGAELVYFIVPNRKDFEIIASKKQNNIETNAAIQVNEGMIPISILHYVLRSKQPVLLENASKNAIYRNDPYIKANNTLSILCLPVVKNNQTIGIIYFENNLIVNAPRASGYLILEYLSSLLPFKG